MCETAFFTLLMWWLHTKMWLKTSLKTLTSWNSAHLNGSLLTSVLERKTFHRLCSPEMKDNFRHLLYIFFLSTAIWRTELYNFKPFTTGTSFSTLACFVKTCGPDLGWKRVRRVPSSCAVTHLEKSVQRSVFHELRYDHHWLTYGGTEKKAAVSGSGITRKKDTNYKETRTERQRSPQLWPASLSVSLPLSGG